MKGIMIQGTASGVGKSTLMLGLCRALYRMGYSVAPFKAQNLSSNAYLFSDGRQMARSQALAAWACGIEPDTDMNPVLLKPKAVTGSEIILQGKSLGDIMSYEYGSLKEKLADASLKAFHRLSAQYDVVVVEGAGSPVELNLRDHDIVNMGFAEAVNCPVLLTGDISRGGIFASLYGTLALMEPKERNLVRGLLVNKFCGSPEYFSEGRTILEKITEKPVLGVIPEMQISIEDEDGLEGIQNTRTQADIERNLPDGIDYRTHLEHQFNLLADVFCAHTDMKQILSIIR